MAEIARFDDVRKNKSHSCDHNSRLATTLVGKSFEVIKKNPIGWLQKRYLTFEIHEGGLVLRLTDTGGSEKRAIAPHDLLGFVAVRGYRDKLALTFLSNGQPETREVQFKSAKEADQFAQAATMFTGYVDCVDSMDVVKKVAKQITGNRSLGSVSSMSSLDEGKSYIDARSLPDDNGDVTLSMDEPVSPYEESAPAPAGSEDVAPRNRSASVMAAAVLTGLQAATEEEEVTMPSAVVTSPSMVEPMSPSVDEPLLPADAQPSTLPADVEPEHTVIDAAAAQPEPFDAGMESPNDASENMPLLAQDGAPSTQLDASDVTIEASPAPAAAVVPVAEPAATSALAVAPAPAPTPAPAPAPAPAPTAATTTIPVAVPVGAAPPSPAMRPTTTAATAVPAASQLNARVSAFAKSLNASPSIHLADLQGSQSRKSLRDLHDREVEDSVMIRHLQQRRLSLFEKQTDNGGQQERRRIFVQFHVRRFIEQFLVQTLFPLSMPYVMWKYGLSGLRAIGFLTTQIGFIIWSWVMPLVLILVNIGMFRGDLRPQDGGPFLAQIVIIDCYYVVRTTTIAFKYAYMATPDFVKLMSASAKDWMEVQGQVQLIQGWINPSFDQLQSQMSMAAARARINFHEHIIHRSGTRFVQDMLKTVPPAMGHHLGYQVRPDSTSMGWIGTYVMHNAVHGETQWAAVVRNITSLALVLAVVQIFLPSGQHAQVIVSATPISVFGLIGTFFCQCMLFFNLYYFLAVALHDYYRRAQVNSTFTAMLEPQVVRNTQSGLVEWELPFIDGLRPCAIVGWCKLRRVLHNTGIQFQYRVQTYLSLLLAVLAIMLVLTCFSLFDKGGLVALVEPDTLVQFILTVYNLLVASAVLLCIIGLGDWANEETALQIGAIVAQCTELGELQRSHKVQSNPRHVEYIHRARAALEDVKKFLKNEDRFRPVMIFGIRADRFLLQSIGVGFFSVAAVAYRVLMGTKS